MPKAKAFNAALQALKNKLPPGMFSTLDELIEAAPQERMTAQQWKEYLSPGRILTREGINFPLKKEELDYALPFLNTLDERGAGAMIEKKNIQSLARRQRPSFHVIDPSDAGEGHEFASYSTQGPNRLGYIQSLTDSPSFGAFPTHFNESTLSWHRGSRHALEPGRDPRIYPDSPVLRLIDEVQSDRHQKAADKYLFRASGSRDPNPTIPGDGTFPLMEGEEVRRLGYRTPKQEAQWQSVKDPDDDPSEAYPYVETNRRMDIRNQLRSIPPDAPFKDPADYGRLELKKGLLDAVASGDRYLGVTPSEGPIGWFNSDADVIPGMQHAYDKIYPGELRKLANQYGAPMHSLDLPISSRSALQLDSLEEFGAADIPDYFEAILEGAEKPQDLLTGVQGLHRELVGKAKEQLAQGDDPNLERFVTAAKSTKRNLEHYLNRENPESILDDGVMVPWNQWHDSLIELHNSLLGSQAAETSTRKVPAMELTPEVVDKIKKAGIPLWALTGGLIGVDAMTGDHTEGPALAGGGEVKPDLWDEIVNQELEADDQRRIPKSKSLGTLSKVAAMLGAKNGAGLRQQLAAGIASQLYGPDVEGKAKFLGLDPRRTTPGLTGLPALLAMMHPGIVDETAALPNMFGHGPKFSKQAEGRTEALNDQIKASMGIDDPRGFAENMAHAGGTMLAQLPVGVEAAGKEGVVQGAGLLKRLGQAAQKYGTGAAEWFSPTVKPGVGNYASGALFGGTLGTSPEWIQALAEKHPEVVEALLAPSQGREAFYTAPFASGGMVQIPEQGVLGQIMADGNYPTSTPSTPGLPAGAPRTYIGSPKTEADLAHYGEGPEARYFTDNAAPIPIDFSKTGIPAQPQATSGNMGGSQLAGVLSTLPAIYKGLGSVDSLLGTGLQSSVKSGAQGLLKSIGLGGSNLSSGASLAALPSGLADIPAADLAGLTAGIPDTVGAELAASGIGGGTAAAGAGAGLSSDAALEASLAPVDSAATLGEGGYSAASSGLGGALGTAGILAGIGYGFFGQPDYGYSLTDQAHLNDQGMLSGANSPWAIQTGKGEGNYISPVLNAEGNTYTDSTGKTYTIPKSAYRPSKYAASDLTESLQGLTGNFWTKNTIQDMYNNLKSQGAQVPDFNTFAQSLSDMLSSSLKYHGH